MGAVILDKTLAVYYVITQKILGKKKLQKLK